MRIWDTSKLAGDIVAGRISSSEKLIYFVLGQVLYAAVGYASMYGFSNRSWIFVYEAVVVCVIAFVGAHRVASMYAPPLDASFFEAAYLLSIPLFIKATLAAWFLIYAMWWTISATVPHLQVESQESANAIGYWINRAELLFPFLIAAIVNIVYWLRLAHHVRYVAQHRGA